MNTTLHYLPILKCAFIFSSKLEAPWRWEYGLPWYLHQDQHTSYHIAQLIVSAIKWSPVYYLAIATTRLCNKNLPKLGGLWQQLFIITSSYVGWLQIGWFRLGLAGSAASCGSSWPWCLSIGLRSTPGVIILWSRLNRNHTREAHHVWWLRCKRASSAALIHF